jgi:hypothetical protein
MVCKLENVIVVYVLSTVQISGFLVLSRFITVNKMPGLETLQKHMVATIQSNKVEIFW